MRMIALSIVALSLSAHVCKAQTVEQTKQTTAECVSYVQHYLPFDAYFDPIYRQWHEIGNRMGSFYFEKCLREHGENVQ